MSERNDNIDIELSALIDGELNEDRRLALEARIYSDPALEERLADYRDDAEKLRRIYGPIKHRPIPKKWLAIANRSRPVTSWRLVGSIAAALLVAIVGTISLMEWRTPVAGEVVQEALNARSDVVQPEKTVAVEAGAVVDRYADVLRSAVGSNVKVPDMRKAGYRLAAIRIFARGAAELSYRDRQSRVVTLFVRRSDGTPRFDQFERNGLRVCIWQDEKVAMVVAGAMSEALMQHVAALAYSGLT